jgi:tetratricopeptide (TPR) repeat protein
MTLPNFLGIGAARSGTSWLDRVLRSHPDLYLPERRKEIDFFHKYYDRGIDWYQEFFPSCANASQYRNIGEISPDYFYYEGVPERIKEYLPNCRFILILRNPADRAYSHYGFLIRELNEQRTFQDFFEQEPEVFYRGLYYQQLQLFLQHFSLDNFLILIYEHTMSNPEQALRKLANFLNIDPNKFDKTTINQKVNASSLVRFPRTRLLARSLRNSLRQKDLDWLWNAAKASGIARIFEKPGNISPIDSDVKASIISKYQSDITALEELIGIDISIWKKNLSYNEKISNFINT